MDYPTATYVPMYCIVLYYISASTNYIFLQENHIYIVAWSLRGKIKKKKKKIMFYLTGRSHGQKWLACVAQSHVL